MALNKRITGAQSWEQILGIVRDSDHALFDAVNVGTAFHRLAKLGVQSSRRPREADLLLLVPLLESKVDELDGQNLANVLWSYAKLDVKPRHDLFVRLSGVVERSAGAFNPQNVANTLWAYATLGEAPSVSVLDALSGVV